MSIIVWAVAQRRLQSCRPGRQSRWLRCGRAPHIKPSSRR